MQPKTITSLALLARREADFVNSQFVDEPELYEYINYSASEYYGLLIQKAGPMYFTKQHSFNTIQNQQAYILPQDFFKLQGVDAQIFGQNNPPIWYTLKQFEFPDRNRVPYANPYTWFGMSNVRYHLTGDNLYFVPVPNSSQAVRIWYAPTMPKLAQTSTITLAYVAVADTITLNICDAQSDLDSTYNKVWTCVAGAPGAQEFQLGTTDSITATNLAAALTGAAWGQRKIFAAVDGTTTTQVNLTLPQAATKVYWSAAPTMDLSAPIYWSNFLYDVNGWAEYVVIDAAIKMKDKEESDCSLLMARKAVITDRLESETENRNQGDSPATSETGYNDVNGGIGQGPYGGGMGGVGMY